MPRRTLPGVLFLRLAFTVAWLVGLLIAPATVFADHCGATATVTPASGPPRTTFVFRTNLGAPSDLHLYRNGTLVRSVALDGNGFVTYAIRTSAADLGTWRARAVVRGQGGCAAEATFTLIGTPDTSTINEPAVPSVPWAVAPIAGAIAWAFGFQRLRARRYP